MLNPDPTNAEEIPVSASAFLSLMSLYSVAGQVVKAISKPSVAMLSPFVLSLTIVELWHTIVMFSNYRH